jgi:deoxycytidylate deaminase
MCFRLGAVLVKGGKVLSSGYNHQRPHYQGPGHGQSHCNAVVRIRLAATRLEVNLNRVRSPCMQSSTLYLLSLASLRR